MRPSNLVSGLILKIRSGLFVIQDLSSVSVVLIAVALTAQNDLLERETSTIRTSILHFSCVSN